MKRTTLTILIIFGVLIFDQLLKIWIKTNMTYGEEFGILGLSWARIHFVENEGMAFGISFGGNGGKLALSIFRLVAVAFLGYILASLIKAKETHGLIACFALILAGAVGNILDSAFYGMFFSASSYHGVPATMFPPEGGYAPFLYGRVVDMFYFPVIDFHWPDWMPVWGGDRFQFFKPVFNVADSAISVGVISMLLFHRGFLRTGTSKDEKPADVNLESQPDNAKLESQPDAKAGSAVATQTPVTNSANPEKSSETTAQPDSKAASADSVVAGTIIADTEHDVSDGDNVSEEE